jgi:carbonic anhydrase
MTLTRRQFTSFLGLLTIGAPAAAHAASGGLNEALSPKAPAAPPAKAAAPAAAAKPAPPASPAPAKAPTTPEEIWADLMEGNKRFVAGKPQARVVPARREELAKGQHPRVVVLTCSDSRVSPTLAFDKSLGDLFVIRTAGNVADPIALGSIEYAAEHLHAKVLVVMGHEKCGAVSAALSGEKMPTRNLDAIVRKIAPAVDKVKSCGEGDQLLGLAVESNVRHSARSLVEDSPILAAEVAAKKLTVIQAVYRLKTGEVVRLA